MQTPIQETMTAIREGTVAVLRRLLANYPDLGKNYGTEMLKHAAECSRVDMLKALVAEGMDINGLTDYDRRAPLHEAARKGATDAAVWLLDHGAKIDRRRDENSVTPLHEAAAEGQLEIVKLLLERGANPDALHGYPRGNVLAAARFAEQHEVVAFLEGRGIKEIVIEPEPVNVEDAKFTTEFIEDPPAWFEKKWWHVYNYAERRGFKNLSEKNRVLFLVGYLVDQICNGGTMMAYFNPSGRYAKQMVAALKRIGALKAAKMMAEINNAFPGGAPADDFDTRAMQIEELPPEIGEIANKLEDQTEIMVAQLHRYYFS